MFVVPIMLSFQRTRGDPPPILRRMRFVRFSSAWARQVCHFRLGWSCRMPDFLPCAFSVLSGGVSQSEGLLGFCLGALDTEPLIHMAFCPDKPIRAGFLGSFAPCSVSTLTGRHDDGD